MRTEDVPTRAGHQLTPRIVSNRLARTDENDLGKRVESLMERTRLRVAPQMPSRAESVFATTGASVGTWQVRMADRGDRTLVRLQPAHADRVAAFDTWHYRRAVDALTRAGHSDSPAQKRALEREAHRAAVAYWTRPVTKDSLVEVLLGGGAVYVGKEASPAKPK